MSTRTKKTIDALGNGTGYFQGELLEKLAAYAEEAHALTEELFELLDPEQRTRWVKSLPQRYAFSLDRIQLMLKLLKRAGSLAHSQLEYFEESELEKEELSFRANEMDCLYHHLKKLLQSLELHTTGNLEIKKLRLYPSA